MLPNMTYHAAFIEVVETRFPDRLIQYNRAFRLNSNVLSDDSWKRVDTLDPEFSIYSLPQINVSNPRKHKASSAPPKPSKVFKPVEEQYCFNWNDGKGCNPIP